MDAQVRLLCYPRGSFYPLSSVPPTKDRRITKTYFRTCLSRHSRSQAGLCFYTFSTMSIRTKPTFVSLRYLLARYRPSKTASLALSPPPFPGGMGKPHISQRVVLHWYSRAARKNQDLWFTNYEFKPSKLNNESIVVILFLNLKSIFLNLLCYAQAPTYSAQSKNMKAIPSYSKAPRGLFVLVE